MPINIAMPVAHITGAATYADWYDATGNCIFEVANYFNRGGAKGISLRASTAGAGVANALWNLYAFTDGFLSFRNNSLILRLPRELNSAATKAHNSGKMLLSLTPGGPQLRHVVYAFSATPSQAAVEDKIRAVLTDATHPGRTITMVQLSDGGTQRLQEFLAAPANLEAIVEDFLFGVAEVFVKAGDVIGNFDTLGLQIRFHDSCGNLTPGVVTGSPIIVKGRPLNPSYFLYLVRSQANTVTTQRVTLLTNLNAAPQHPLDHLFAATNIPAAGNPDQALDLVAPHPPKPLHVTVPVQTGAGDPMADRGIGIGALGEWHESRNAANPYSTVSPVEWRNFGNQAGEVNIDNFCRFLTQVKTGKTSVLPGGEAFDHNHIPTATHTSRVRAYWQRYDRVVNVVAEALEIPCELLLALACTETSTGAWYDPVFSASREMDVIRMEPLQRQPAVIEPANAVLQGRLTTYMAITGGLAGGGANAYLPTPWNGGGQVKPPHLLTWTQLAELIRRYTSDVKVSPGVMQTLVKTAKDDMDWIASFYGNTVVCDLEFVHAGTGITLTADAPPATLDLLFSGWFAVAVDATGTNTNVAPIDDTLTQMKRAFHSLIAGGCHIKRSYNSVAIGLNGSYNLICDFDLPSVASGYNDSAMGVAAATAVSQASDQWKNLFALMFADQSYPQNAPKFFNAAVDYFNTDFVAAAPPLAKPTLRLWRP